MTLDQLKGLLEGVATRVAGWPFDRLSALSEVPWVEEFGSPAVEADGDYCQIEAAVLQRLSEGDLELLNITVTADDWRSVVGTVLVAYSDGTIEWDRTKYLYVDGVPQLLE
jgi:hypothetical protein